MKVVVQVGAYHGHQGAGALVVGLIVLSQVANLYGLGREAGASALAACLLLVEVGASSPASRAVVL